MSKDRKAVLKEQYVTGSGRVIEAGRSVYVRKTRKLDTDPEELAVCSTTKGNLWSGLFVIPTRLLNL
jgi:hypothetical protein